MNLTFLLPLVMLMVVPTTVAGGVSITDEAATGGILATQENTKCPTVIQTFNHSGSTVYMVNETIRLSCSHISNNNPNMSLFYLVHHGSEVKQRLEPSYAVGNQAVFEIEAAAVDDDGQYDCFYGNCSEQNPWRSFTQIHVIDQTKPHLECMSSNTYNYTTYNMTCTWFRRNDKYNSCWMIQYASRHLTGVLQPFQNCSGKNEYLCAELYYEQSCTMLLNGFLYTMEYEVRLLENLSIGDKVITAAYNYTVPANESIVKLNPVVGANVSADALRQVTLTWMFEGSPITLTDKILCHISYWSEWEDQNDKQVYEFIITNPRALHKYSRQLDSLEPFTGYTFSMKIKLVTSPYWSEAVNLEGKTLPEVPVVIPKNVAHTEEIFNDSHRTVDLYWEPVQPRFYYGPNASYILNITCTDQSEWTEEFPATVYTARINQYLSSSSSCDINVQSENSIGSSEKMTTIHIPPLQKNSEPAFKVQEEELGQNTYNVVVMDTSLRSEDVKYTYYWCQGYRKRNIPVCLENYHSLLSRETNVTIVVNQSNDQNALFFGASSLEGNQSSSLVWASDDTDLVSEGPVVKENDVTQMIKIVVGVCVSVVIMVVVVVVRCVYPRMKNRFKHYDIKIPDISGSQPQLPSDIPSRNINIEEADILAETISNTNTGDSQRSSPPMRQESSISISSSTDSREALLRNCGSEHQVIESSSDSYTRIRLDCETMSRNDSDTNSRNDSETMSRTDNETKSRNDSNTRSRNGNEPLDNERRTVIAEAVCSQNPDPVSSPYLPHNAFQDYVELNTHRNVPADSESEHQGGEFVLDYDTKIRHDCDFRLRYNDTRFINGNDVISRNDSDTRSRNACDARSRNDNEPSDSECISDRENVNAEAVSSQNLGNESSPYVPHNAFQGHEGLNTHRHALAKSEHQDGENILDCDTRSRHDSDTWSRNDNETSDIDYIPERRTDIVEADFSANPDIASSPYLPHDAVHDYKGLNAHRNVPDDRHLSNVNDNASDNDRNLPSGSDCVSGHDRNLSTISGNMSNLSGNIGGYVSHSAVRQERSVDSYVRTYEDHNMLWIQSIGKSTEGQIKDENSGRIQSSTNDAFGNVCHNERNLSTVSGNVCYNNRNLPASSGNVPGYVSNDAISLQESSDNSMSLTQIIRTSTEGQINDGNAGRIHTSTNVFGNMPDEDNSACVSDNDRNLSTASGCVSDNDRNLSTDSCDVSDNDRNPSTGSNNVPGYVSNGAFSLQDCSLDSYIRTSMENNILSMQSIRAPTEGQNNGESAGRLQNITNDVVGNVSDNDRNLSASSGNVHGYVSNDAISLQESSVDSYVRTSMDNNMLMMQSIETSTEGQINDGNAGYKQNSTNV